MRTDVAKPQGNCVGSLVWIKIGSVGESIKVFILFTWCGFFFLIDE
jgi:hypothetical protein